MADPGGARLRAWEHAAEWPLAVLAAIFLALYAVDILVERLPAGWSSAFQIADYVIWALFAAEYVVRLVLADDRLRYWWRNLPDLAIIVLPVLRPLRILRLLLLLKILNRRAADSLRGRVLVYGVSAAILLVFCGALAVLDAERHHPGANITTFGNALWWAVVTITTVGYGDYRPITVEGRLVAVGMMVAGLALLGAVTASFASWLIERLRDEEEVEETATRHDLQALHAQLGRMEQQLGDLRGALGGAHRQRVDDRSG